MKNYITQIKEQLKEKGYKLTEQRLAILEIILKNKGKHLNSQEIYYEVKKEYPKIGVATVYRTIPIFEKIGVIYGEYFGDGSIRYEVAKENELHRHHHLICKECGAIEECNDDLLNSVEDEIYKRKQFKITDHIVEFYGYCKKCMLKKEKEKE